MPRDLLNAYPTAEGRYDEFFQGPRVPRAHWKALYEQIVEAPPELMRERALSVQRQIRENGVTFNVYADPEGADRPWSLDLLPMVLPPEEWAGIEAAVRQRATLLDAVLRDVYGGQRLLAEGALPPALIYGHAGYLRPCRHAAPADQPMLHFYAADLARSPDGRWWVVDDRTQAPSGMGYALENRLVISRLFPELFRDLKVQRLAGFFATIRDSLAHWAPSGGESPFIALLTPGPHNETYFEHTYLARYLGFALVEGTDLTVRDGKVWLKTLTGLTRVHGIVRRQDDDYCDPLELRNDSALGIPGLVDAVRRGNVLVANALGSNLLESGALLGFLPALSRRLLGEELRMPSVATWWCGEKAALESVVEKLGRLVIKGAFPQNRGPAVFGEDLDAKGRARMAEQLRANPSQYVAQELVQMSQAPVWDMHHSRRLLGRAVGLRVYACATPNGYVVMPGGLTRVASEADARVISTQGGGSSKDTWVLTTGAVSEFSLLRRETRVQDLVRTGTNLSSRVVENLFWLGRNTERCDDTARLLRVALGRLLDDAGSERARSWPGIARMLVRTGILAPGEHDPEDLAVVRTLRSAIVDPEKPGLASGLTHLLRVASQLRERLSIDNWRTLNHMTRRLARVKDRPIALAEALAELDRDIAAFMTLSGFALDGMTRDAGWRFLSIGRRIERLQYQCDVLREALAGDADSDLGWVLELADSSVTYRSRYHSRPEWLPMLDLLICDPTNPRSIAFQVNGLNDYLVKVADTYGDAVDEDFGAARASLESLDAGRDLRHGSETLIAQIDGWYGAAFRLSEQLGRRFFSHVGETSRQTFAY